MSSINKHIVLGRLGADPEVRYTQSNIAVATVSIATSERYKDKDGQVQEKTQWHRVTFWNKLAEIASQYLKKGSLVYVEGPAETREWEDKDGIKRYTTEIKAREMKMLSSKGEGQGQGAPVAPKQGSNTLPSNMDDVDDDLPF